MVLQQLFLDVTAFMAQVVTAVSAMPIGWGLLLLFAALSFSAIKNATPAERSETALRIIEALLRTKRPPH